VHCKNTMSAASFDSSPNSKVRASKRDVQTTGLGERHRDPSEDQG